MPLCYAAPARIPPTDRLPAAMNDEIKPNPAFDAIRAAGGPLASQLARYFEAMAARNPAAGKAYDDVVAQLVAAGAGAGAPKAGDRLPGFLLPDGQGRLVALADLLAAGPQIVSLNRGNWCPFCWLELSALGEIHTAVRERCGNIVSISPETAIWNRRLSQRLNLPFPVLTDIDNGYALELGLAVAMPAPVLAVYEKAGIDLARYQNGAGNLLPLPATYVVGTDGIVLHAFVDGDFRKRVDPADILAALKADR